jgi:hypothetical protein
MAKLFISHATSDRAFVESELMNLLRALGFETWFAEEDINTTEEWERAILTGLQSSEWFMLVMSSKSSASRWVKQEVHWAIDNRKGRIIPILFQDCDQTEIHPFLPSIEHIDFRNDLKNASRQLIKFLVDIEYSPRGKRAYVESLIIEITDTDKFLKSCDAAIVYASDGCGQILNLTKNRFTWKELQTRAEEERGKGTFWITEIRDVIKDVLVDKEPRVMTSTFRGRGDKVKGQIFRPQLHHVHSSLCFYLFYFDIYEVLVPELVRGPDLIGEVFFLLYIVSRVRWEVLNPFFVKPILRGNQNVSILNENEKYRLINEVSGSLRAIESELDRNNKWDEAFVIREFKGKDRDSLLRMLDERNDLRKKITDAIRRKNYSDLMGELEQGLELNIKATALLARKFAALAKKDQKELEGMLMRLRTAVE